MSLKARMSVLDANRRIGSVCAIYPGRAVINLADSSARPPTTLYGSPRGSGQVSEYVLVEVDGRTIIIGRMTSVRLAERERLAINPTLGDPAPVDPIGEVDLLATFDAVTGEVSPGIEVSPRLGSAIFSPAPALLAELVSKQREPQPVIQLDLGCAISMPEARIRVSPERLFGRHCAILGATGGGKSFTVAKLLEEVSKTKGKAILIDATGEFYSLDDLATHVSLGSPLHNEEEVYFPISSLEEQDLYGLFQPSGKVQGPKLREAILSLRIAQILDHTPDPDLVSSRDRFRTSGLLQDGLIKKANKERREFELVSTRLRARIEAPNAPFDVTLLASQVLHECTGVNRNDPSRFGPHDEYTEGNCSPLISRIQVVTRGSELKVFFNEAGANLLQRIRDFLASPQSILRISLASVPYSFNAREIVANSLGRWLLRQARDGVFRRLKPTILFLDEAHNFLSRRIGEEDGSIKLDAFDQIAKEGRKHWLTIALATQRPRDLPEGVMSQMGAMIVHRLTNHRDRELVERACGDIDRSSVALLPTLAPGHAALIGADFPFPLTTLIDEPQRRPDSGGPDFQGAWGKDAPNPEPEPLLPSGGNGYDQGESVDSNASAPLSATSKDPPPPAQSTGQEFVLPLRADPDDDDLPF